MIQKYNKDFGLRWFLRKFNICSNAYYNYLKNRKADYHQQKDEIKNSIREIYHSHGGVDGYTTVHGKVSFESYDYAEKYLPGIGFENSTVLKAELVSLLNRLDKRDRDIVVKFYIYGQSIKGIAESLGLPESLVERRKSLALKQLRDCLL